MTDDKIKFSSVFFISRRIFSEQLQIVQGDSSAHRQPDAGMHRPQRLLSEPNHREHPAVLLHTGLRCSWQASRVGTVFCDDAVDELGKERTRFSPH